MQNFYSSDIVVWNKIIATYGSVKLLVMEGDEVRLANYNEKQKFKEIRK